MSDPRRPLNLEAATSYEETLSVSLASTVAQIQSIVETFKAEPAISNTMIADLEIKVGLLKTMVDAIPTSQPTQEPYYASVLSVLIERVRALSGGTSGRKLKGALAALISLMLTPLLVKLGLPVEHIDTLIIAIVTIFGLQISLQGATDIMDAKKGKGPGRVA
jgi:hypothetical protein